MAPIKRNRNRERKNVIRRRGKNSGKKSHKYSGSSDDSRVEKRTKRKINSYKLETAGIRNKKKYQRMGAGRYSKLARSGDRGSSDRVFDSRNKSGEIRAKRYIRKALEFGLASGYLVPEESSGRQVLRVSSDIMEFGNGNGADRSESDDGADDSSTGGRGHASRGPRTPKAGKRLAGKKNGKMVQKNIRKRGRSRTKSPKKPGAQKRRRKLSTCRPKTTARARKRKRVEDTKNDEPATPRGRGTTDVASVDDDDEKDPDPDVENNVNNDKDDTKKLPASSRPGSGVPDAENRATDGNKKQDETSEPSGEEATDDDEEEEEEEEEELEEDEGLETEDPVENNENLKPEKS